MEIFTLWLGPLLAVILLPPILVYFGLHVVERGVIFVDLALAQVAALGVCVAVMLGSHPEHDLAPLVLSLLFTLAGAALFSVTRFRSSRVPHEAFIGIIYIVSAAAALIVLSRSAEGDEVIKSLLAGNVLLVRPRDVGLTFALYAAIGALHFALRRPFHLVTFDPAGAEKQGMRLRLWDFLFYATFGIVVTSFVQVAGVYLVFTYLIVPAVCGALLARGSRARLLVGWTVALAGGLAGLLVSTQAASLDLPTGPTIVCALGVLLLLCGAVAGLRRGRAGSASGAVGDTIVRSPGP